MRKGEALPGEAPEQAAADKAPQIARCSAVQVGPRAGEER